MKQLLFLIFAMISFMFSFSQSKSYCYKLSSGELYKINLFESDEKYSKIDYNYYDFNGDLTKSLHGFYNIIDEGVYSQARKIIANFSGSIVKWLILYDISGKAQNIQDEINNTIWDKCQ